MCCSACTRPLFGQAGLVSSENTQEEDSRLKRGEKKGERGRLPGPSSQASANHREEAVEK